MQKISRYIPKIGIPVQIVRELASWSHLDESDTRGMTGSGARGGVEPGRLVAEVGGSYSQSRQPCAVCRVRCTLALARD